MIFTARILIFGIVTLPPVTIVNDEKVEVPKKIEHDNIPHIPS